MMTSKMCINQEIVKSKQPLINKQAYTSCFLFVFIYSSFLPYFPCIFKPNFNKITEEWNTSKIYVVITTAKIYSPKPFQTKEWHTQLSKYLGGTFHMCIYTKLNYLVLNTESFLSSQYILYNVDYIRPVLSLAFYSRRLKLLKKVTE